MNIGIFTDTYFPQISGVATSIRTLKEDLERKGHSVYIFTTTDPNVGKNEHEPNVYRFGSVPFPSFTERRIAIRGLFKAVTVARKLNLDIVHTQTEFSMGYIGKYVAHALKIPAIHTYHTMYEDYLHYIMNGHLLRPSGVKQISRAFLYHMTGLICPSQRVMDTMIRYGIKIPMRIIPTGVDLSAYRQPSTINLREEYHIPADSKVILSVSRVAYEKNIDFLIRSFAELIKKIKNVYLFIVGDGPAIDDLKVQIRNLGIEKNVIFTGYVLHSKVVTYYQQADIFASASNTEAQGLTFIESLAAKTQVLAWDNDYDRQLLSDPSLGSVFQTESQLTDLMLEYLTMSIPMDDQILNPVLQHISADHFGDQILDFYGDLSDHYEEEKQEELDEEEASLMRRVSRYLKLTPSTTDEELRKIAIGYYGEGKYRSLILSSFGKENYNVFANRTEDDATDSKKVTMVNGSGELFERADIIFAEVSSQSEFLQLARKCSSDQVIVNLSEMLDFNLDELRKDSKSISSCIFDTQMVVNDFESINLLVGGDQEKYDKISPIFDVFTDDVLYLGELGSAHVGMQALTTLRDHVSVGVEAAIDQADLPGVDLRSVLDLISDTDETYFIRHVGNRKIVDQGDSK